MAYYVYILSNESNKVLYIGMTNDIVRRLYEHKNKLVKGFTSRYNLKKLLYVETTDDVNSAIEREKTLKKWRREKKEFLIKTINPDYKDLSKEWGL